MKVLVISHMYPSTFNEVYGIFVHEQVKALMKAGVELRVVSATAWTPGPVKRVSRKWEAISEIPRSAVVDGVQVQYPRYVVFPRAWFFSSSGRRMYRGIEKSVAAIHGEFPFDIVHAHVALPDGYAGALLAAEYGVPLVITVHGQDFQHTVHRSTGSRRALDFALSQADRVITVSQKLKRLGSEHFGIDNKLRVVPNGVDPSTVTGSNGMPVGQRRKNGLSILSVSNLVAPKGIDLNLAALKRLVERYPAVIYTVVGGGLGEARLRQMATALDLEGRVTFLGRLPHAQVMRLMADCDIFSLPSWEEGFGVVYLEAMANGKPVIGCKGQGIEDFVEHGNTGLLVKLRDVDSLTEALDFLLSHPEEARAMG
ncbi:MAG: glycosyltransferase, partial [bacterium]